MRDSLCGQLWVVCYDKSEGPIELKAEIVIEDKPL